MKVIGIIPARFGSSRFPGKPLADINGKSMIMRVYEQAKKAYENVYVATDDQQIFEHVKQNNGKVILTSTEHKSGTERCAEAYNIIKNEEKRSFDIVVNIQGDEPFISENQLKSILTCFSKNTQIATLTKKITDYNDIFDINKPKVVFDNNLFAIYFSRSPIPYFRNIEKSNWLNHGDFYKHIGLYAYNSDILQEIVKLKQSKLELAESLEQLRWIENGFKIKVKITDEETISVDTAEDLEKAKLFGR